MVAQLCILKDRVFTSKENSETSCLIKRKEMEAEGKVRWSSPPTTCFEGSHEPGREGGVWTQRGPRLTASKGDRAPFCSSRPQLGRPRAPGSPSEPLVGR